MAVYKREGEDENQKEDREAPYHPVSPPTATSRSGFLTEIQQKRGGKPIAPQFLDFERTHEHRQDGQATSRSSQAERDQRPLLPSDLLLGFRHRKRSGALVMSEYLTYLGTDAHSQEGAGPRFLRSGLRLPRDLTLERTYVLISGAGREYAGRHATGRGGVAALRGRRRKFSPRLSATSSRPETTPKLDQSANFRALYNYVRFGSEWVKACTLTDEQLLALDSDDLLAKLRGLNDIEHRILYYGPLRRSSSSPSSTRTTGSART